MQTHLAHIQFNIQRRSTILQGSDGFPGLADTVRDPKE